MEKRAARGRRLSVGAALGIALVAVACGAEGGGAAAADGARSADTTARSGGAGPAGAAAALAVVRAYYAAIDAGDYARAYRYWGDDGRNSHQTLEEFRQGFARTASVSVDAGPPGRIGAAAGSRYVTIPVRVHARTRSGGEQCFRGSYILRRAVVDGATAAQRRWSLYSAKLSAVGASACRQDGAAAWPGRGESGEIAGQGPSRDRDRGNILYGASAGRAPGGAGYSD